MVALLTLPARDAHHYRRMHCGERRSFASLALNAGPFLCNTLRRI